MWVCRYEQFPDISFLSSSDQDGLVPGLQCRKLEKPLPGGTLSQFLSFQKLARLIDVWPW